VPVCLTKNEQSFSKRMTNRKEDGGVWSVAVVNETDLMDLLPLLKAYGRFYNATEGIALTSDELLLSVSRALIDDPQNEGIQLLVRSNINEKAVGFATIYWSWSTLKGGRIAILEDLYVVEECRGKGIGDLLIERCRQFAQNHGALCLTWQTSMTNKPAQDLYARTGAMRSDRWLNYTLSL
jgi:GNAT superfamily N-acetyltransferase